VFITVNFQLTTRILQELGERFAELGKPVDVTAVTPHTITRRPFAFWAALAVLLIFASSASALFLATYLAELI
jgi:hypothetical protein